MLTKRKDVLIVDGTITTIDNGDITRVLDIVNKHDLKISRIEKEHDMPVYTWENNE